MQATIHCQVDRRMTTMMMMFCQVMIAAMVMMRKRGKPRRNQLERALWRNQQLPEGGKSAVMRMRTVCCSIVFFWFIAVPSCPSLLFTARMRSACRFSIALKMPELHLRRLNVMISFLVIERMTVVTMMGTEPIDQNMSEPIDGNMSYQCCCYSGNMPLLLMTWLGTSTMMIWCAHLLQSFDEWQTIWMITGQTTSLGLQSTVRKTTSTLPRLYLDGRFIDFISSTFRLPHSKV